MPQGRRRVRHRQSRRWIRRRGRRCVSACLHDARACVCGMCVGLCGFVCGVGVPVCSAVRRGPCTCGQHRRVGRKPVFPYPCMPRQLRRRWGLRRRRRLRWPRVRAAAWVRSPHGRRRWPGVPRGPGPGGWPWLPPRPKELRRRIRIRVRAAGGWGKGRRERKTCAHHTKAPHVWAAMRRGRGVCGCELVTGARCVTLLCCVCGLANAWQGGLRPASVRLWWRWLGRRRLGWWWVRWWRRRWRRWRRRWYGRRVGLRWHTAPVVAAHVSQFWSGGGCGVEGVGLVRAHHL